MAAPNFPSFARSAPIPITAPRRPATALRTEAVAERERELRLKRDIDRVANAIDRAEQRAARFAAEIKRLQRRQQIQLQRAEHLETEVMKRMEAARLTKLTGCERTLTLRPNALSLVVLDESLIPQAYFREVPASKAADKTLIKAILARAAAPTASEQEIAAAAAIKGVKLMQTVSLIRK